ncbi:type II secretion system protein [Frigoribacterium sp. PhB118]|uniref:type II secretion system protein n=1 Tax=Frigoribacterium TaxID=96492 RepID=UPI000F486FBD|nr:prepilin-type N-terminal cleavage/methylation domain-containing protein [Frigoribacterium sp. PhB118]
MYFTLMGKLSARRQNLTEDKDKGFTLIELLVVVIIIGILAAIAIPVYLGVQNNAKDSSVKNDLTNAKTAIISIQTNNGTLPATADVNFTADAYSAAGATVGTGNTLSYKKITDTTFCIQGNRTGGDNFRVTASTGVEKGSCPA